MESNARSPEPHKPTSIDKRHARLKPILQSAQGECGLACLAMIARTFTLPVTLAQLRDRFRPSPRGLSLTRLISIGEKIGLNCRAIRLEPDELRALRCPAVLHWDMTHFVVLERITRAKAVICDPNIGRVELSMREVGDRFTGIAVEVSHVDPVKWNVTRTERIKLTDVIQFPTGSAQVIALLLGLSGTLELLSLCAPVITQWVIDEIATNGTRELVFTACLGMLVLQLFQHAMTYTRTLVGTRYGVDLALIRKSSLCQRLLRLPIDFFDSRTCGDIDSKFASADAIQKAFLSSLGTFLIDGTIALIAGLVLFTYNPLIATIAFISLAIVTLARALCYPVAMRLGASQMEHAARSSTHFFESIRGIRAIRISGRERERAREWHNLLTPQYVSLYKSMRLSSLGTQAFAIISAVEGIAALFVGSIEVIEQGLTIGALVAITTYRTTFSSRSHAVVDKLFEISMLRVHIDRLSDIISTPADESCDIDTDTYKCMQFSGIHLDDVTFRYAHGEMTLLSRARLTIDAGESVAIVGPSGSGKSTLVKLLLGILEPVRGEINVGGVRSADLRGAVRAGLIAAVMQDDSLFAGSIEENIRAFDAEPESSRVVECAILAGIHDEIQEMPMSYQTLVGDMGSSLSGGQRQRVVLARALYRRPKLLILDEATSHLDLPKEQEIDESIRRLGITRIVIAHRPETIASADRVIELRDGELIEVRTCRSSDKVDRIDPHFPQDGLPDFADDARHGFL